MNIDLHMSWEIIGISFILGLGCACIAMYLLWRTVSLLPRVKYKNTFLTFSFFCRIFLLIFGMLLLSGGHAGRFLVMFCGFGIGRFLILRLTVFQNSSKIEQKQLEKSFNKQGKSKR